MMETLLQLDRDILYLVNMRWSNSFFDALMPWLRHKQNWIPLYVVMAAYLLWVFRKNAWLPIVVCVAAVAVSDQIASSLLKPAFERLRPCQNEMLNVRNVIDCGGGYSFVSSHAATHFALAVSFGSLFRLRHRWILPLLLLWAGLIVYAQVYVGYHYPSDVFVGALIGTGVASVLLLLLRKKIENLETVKTT